MRWTRAPSLGREAFWNGIQFARGRSWAPPHCGEAVSNLPKRGARGKLRGVSPPDDTLRSRPGRPSPRAGFFMRHRLRGRGLAVDRLRGLSTLAFSADRAAPEPHVRGAETLTHLSRREPTLVSRVVLKRRKGGKGALIVEHFREAP